MEQGQVITSYGATPEVAPEVTDLQEELCALLSQRAGHLNVCAGGLVLEFCRNRTPCLETLFVDGCAIRVLGASCEGCMRRGVVMEAPCVSIIRKIQSTFSPAGQDR
jgi:hypothetical protein